MVYSNCWKGKTHNLGFSTQKDYHLESKERERTQRSKHQKSLIPMCMHACKVASVVSDFVRPYGLQPARLLCLWDSPGKNTEVSYHALLLGIFLSQGSNPCLLHLLYWQAGSLPLVPPGKPVQHLTYPKRNVKKHSLSGKEIKYRKGKIPLGKANI